MIKHLLYISVLIGLMLVIAWGAIWILPYYLEVLAN